MRLKIVSIIALISISLALNAQPQTPIKRNDAASKTLFELSPFERAVCCIRFYEGLHRKKDYPYVGYGHKLRPGEKYSSNMTARKRKNCYVKTSESFVLCSAHTVKIPFSLQPYRTISVPIKFLGAKADTRRVPS